MLSKLTRKRLPPLPPSLVPVPGTPCIISASSKKKYFRLVERLYYALTRQQEETQVNFTSQTHLHTKALEPKVSTQARGCPYPGKGRLGWGYRWSLWV